MKRINKFMLASLLFLAAVSVAGCSQQDHTAMTETALKNEQIEGAVRAVLDAQAAAWNRGDIDGFMDGYARSNETTFISGETVTRGWQTVLDRYKKNYDSRDKMGTLAFTDLEIKPLSDDAAIALGHWQLTRTKDSPKGRFTLLFRRTPDGWRIIHDHTS
jgi:ketosteroid isomerase-like protein